MKYTRFFNYEGIFRYWNVAKTVTATLEKTAPGLNRLLQSAVERRLQSAKWRKMGE
jgi:hypothetical protein